jgi:hypothetical protein
MKSSKSSRIRVTSTQSSAGTESDRPYSHPISRARERVPRSGSESSHFPHHRHSPTKTSKSTKPLLQPWRAKKAHNDFLAHLTALLEPDSGPSSSHIPGNDNHNAEDGREDLPTIDSDFTDTQDCETSLDQDMPSVVTETSQPVTSEKEDQHRHWQALLPQLTKPLLDYIRNQQARLPMPTASDSDACSEPTCITKERRIICVYWNRMEPVLIA